MNHDPPANIDLEMQLVGSILLIPQDAYPIASSIVQPQDFYWQGHSDIFDLCGELYRTGTMPDAMTVLDALRRRKRLDSVGGSGVVLGMMNSGTASAHGVEQTARRVLEYSRRRQLSQVCQRAIQACTMDDTPADEIIERIRSASDRILERGTRAEDVTSLHDMAQREAIRLVDLYDAGGPQRGGIHTGWNWLDDASGGYAAGDLWVWAARANTGKSRSMIYSLGKASQTGPNVGFISLDMAEQRLCRYLIPQLANINGEHVHAGDLYSPYSWGEMERQRIHDACWAADSARKFYVVSNARGNRLSNIEGYVRQMVKKHDCRVIAIDQAQNIGGWEGGGKDRSIYAEVMGGLKRMARMYEVCIVILHQVQRAGAAAPTLANLKDTGCMEEFSDFVVLLHDLQRTLIEAGGGFIQDGTKTRKPTAKDKPEDIKRNVELTRPLRIELAKSRHDATRRETVRFDYSRGLSI